jgi:hypothetical protein
MCLTVMWLLDVLALAPAEHWPPKSPRARWWLRAAKECEDTAPKRAGVPHIGLAGRGESRWFQLIEPAREGCVVWGGPRHVLIRGKAAANSMTAPSPNWSTSSNGGAKPFCGADTTATMITGSNLGPGNSSKLPERETP